MSTTPSPDELLRILDSGDDAVLDALEAELQGPSLPSERVREQHIRAGLDLPVAPDGLPDAVLDALHAALQAPEAPPARPTRRWFAAATLVAAMAAGALLWVPATPLVTGEEAAAPVLAPTTRGTVVSATVGPRISAQMTVSAWTGRVSLDLDIEPGPSGVPVDLGSLQVRYLRGRGIDITPRLFTTPARTPVHIDDLALPQGTHTFEATVSDVEGETGLVRFSVDVP